MKEELKCVVEPEFYISDLRGCIWDWIEKNATRIPADKLEEALLLLEEHEDPREVLTQIEELLGIEVIW